jgi:hypothetical protein
MALLRPLYVCFLAAVTLSGCASAGAGSWVELKGKRYVVEMAANEAERARGLMFRDSMAADHGMLFIHESEEPQAYWMKNTRIPLDMLFFDHQRHLVSMQQRVPSCSAGDQCPPYASEGAALYVLELNAGQAETLGVKAGDEVVFGPDIGKHD